MTQYQHFTLSNSRQSTGFTTVTSPQGNHNSPPRPERKTHAEKLLGDLERAERLARQRQKSELPWEGLQFIPMRFSEADEFALELKRLAGSETSGVRIVSQRERGNRSEYVVAVSDGKVGSLAKKFREYREKDTKSGKPKNEPLASSISEINAVDLEDYWTEADEHLPEENLSMWWEIWLESTAGDDVADWFRMTAGEQGITLSQQQVRFPDRLVILAYAKLAHWRKFPGLLRHLAEFRRANLVAGEFTSLSPAGQAEFIDHLLKRTRFADKDSVRICLLDTGVDRGHPLLEASLSREDLQSWRSEWGADDHDGHGTQLAGVCLFGPLSEPLYGDEPIEFNHRLESVKILPPEGKNEPPDYGPITTGSMALAELSASKQSRVFCLAVTADGDDQWRPTLWSASLDQACSGALDGHRRLLVASAGNLRDDVGKNYPEENHVSSIEDPAQAWNVLTVGGYTNLAWIGEEGLEGYTPLARPGSLSPTSRTSLCWGEEPWPYKPDIVLEAGNYAADKSGFVTSAEDLSLLTTISAKTGTALLGTTRDTSAATAQAARMAAILQAEYPDYWPETIRGLIVHSAEWTSSMLEEFPANNKQTKKNRLRVYGMGVPNLDRARRSAKGFATMVIQDEIQPFRFGSGENSTNEMHIHELPLPKEVLEELGSLQVRMRVTLSYFIEPNPPRRGYVARYQYASHGLRFSVRRPQETPERMIARLNSYDWPKQEGKKKRPFKATSDDRAWDLGPEQIAVRGSIHSDAWTGTAVQLASSNLIAIWPVGGWWRYRRDREVVERKGRYSLIVSISTSESEVDLYSMIANQITIESQGVVTRIDV